LGELQTFQIIDQNSEEINNFNVLKSSQSSDNGQKNKSNYEDNDQHETIVAQNFNDSKMRVTNENMIDDEKNVVQRIASFKSFNEFQKRHHLSDLLILSESQEVKVQNLRKTGSIQRISRQSSEEFVEPLIVNHGFLADSDDDLDYSNGAANNDLNNNTSIASHNNNREKIIKKAKSGDSEELNLMNSSDNNSEEMNDESKNKQNGDTVIIERSDKVTNSTPKIKKRLTRKRSMSLSSFNPIEGVFVLKNNNKKDENTKEKQSNQTISYNKNDEKISPTTTTTIISHDHKETKNIVVSSVEIIKTTTTTTNSTTTTQTEEKQDNNHINSLRNRISRNTTTLFWKRRQQPMQNSEKTSNIPQVSSMASFSLFKNGENPNFSLGE
jgi:hypothetical protein